MNQQAVWGILKLRKKKILREIGLRYVVGERVAKELVTYVDVFSIFGAISGAIR
jgi:hypothetical protein